VDGEARPLREDAPQHHGGAALVLGRLKKRGAIREIPTFPMPPQDEHEPDTLSVEEQARVLLAIPETERGAFLAMGTMGLRPGEVRALDARHVRLAEGVLIVSKAAKGTAPDAPIRGTKNRKVRHLPISSSLRAWLEKHLPGDSEAPLFTNPRTKRRFSHWALYEKWVAAVRAAGIGRHVKLYEGTKHSFATDAYRRGVDARVLQAMLGHQDRASTDRYARLSGEMLRSAVR
jgi:integrase